MITHMMHLSTGHLTRETGLILDDWCRHIDLDRKILVSTHDGGPPTLMAASDFGWIVYCTEETDEFPEDLMRCLNFARAADCDHVIFDADGPEEDSLPFYDREGVDESETAA